MSQDSFTERNAKRLLCCEMGLDAAHENWIGGLYDYCKKNQKLPSPYEAQRIKARSAQIRSDIRKMIDDSPLPPPPLRADGFTSIGAAVSRVPVRVLEGLEARNRVLSDMVMAWADGGAMKEAAE